MIYMGGEMGVKMSQVTKKVAEVVADPVSELYAPHEEAVDSRTLLKRYLLDPVLPVLTLLAIGGLTVVILLLVVTAVANMEQVLQASGASNDPWSATAACSDQRAYAAYIAREDALREGDSWSGPPTEEPADARFARGAAQR
jgi:hypothetical protein